jgi:hypothetical protein
MEVIKNVTYLYKYHNQSLQRIIGKLHKIDSESSMPFLPHIPLGPLR